jgi:hypothetical protein
MKRLTQTVVAMTVAGVLAVSPGLGKAAQENSAAEPQQAQTAPLAEPAMDSMDPMVRALLVGLIASLLREAAASPDPLSTLGDSLERKLQFALRSPEFAQVAEGLIGQAVKDVPAELREPLALFAVAMLNNLRREMLDRARPRAQH